MAHPAADVFPLLVDAELEPLVESMRRHGFDPAKPILIYRAEILDGRNRRRAAEIAGVAPVYLDVSDSCHDPWLESWKQNGAPLEPGADGKPATDAAKEAGPAPAPGELDEFPANPPGDAPAPAAQPAAAQPAPPTAAQSLEPPGAAPPPETAPSPGELDGPAGDTAPAPVTEAPAPPPAAGNPAPSGASGPESQELENLLNQ